jgi:hypothetical protein
MNLTTKYMGLTLKNPIVPSASPLTEHMDTIRQLEESGAAALVMHSLFEEQINLESHQLDHFLSHGTHSFAEAQSYFPAGIATTSLSSSIATPAPSADLSTLSLPENFKTLADGLKLTPAGANRAYFVNAKVLAGTEMESKFLQGVVEPDSFYNKKIVGMYSADFSTDSWIELHDLGYDSKNDASLKARTEPA